MQAPSATASEHGCDIDGDAVIGGLMLQISTLYLLACLVAVLLGSMLLVISRNERIAALRWLGIAYLIGAAAIAGWTVFGVSASQVSAYLVGAIGIFACGMVWNAARVFHGKKPTWPGIMAGVACWIVGAALASDATMRVTAGAGIVAAYAALASAELWSERRSRMKRRWPAVLMPVLHGGVLLLPILINEFLAPGQPLSQSWWATLFAFELVLYAVGTVLVTIMLVSERTIGLHKTAALTDALTGMFNRRGFTETANEMIARQAKLGQSVALLLFDIDRFKLINDGFGHPAGDEILKIFAATLTQTLRTTDLSGRMGGEEFAALLPCGQAEAAIAAERVRLAFASSDIAVDDELVVTTVSTGIAAAAAPVKLEELLASADLALYRAKANGRNRIELATDSEAAIATATPRNTVLRTVVSRRAAAHLPNSANLR
jgi:diguanylate cyclase (GGDEF)-like protein